MQVRVINPYTKAGAKHTEALDYIINNVPVNPTFDDVNMKLTEAFFQPDPNDPNVTDLAEDIIKAVLPNVYNGYVNSPWSIVKSQQQDNGKQLTMDNGLWTHYSEAQLRIVQQMLSGIATVQPESISDFLGGMEEQIVAGKLTYAEQAPLLIACAIGKSDSAYWQQQIAIPGAWALYLNADNAINYMHVNSWVAASMQGALLAFGMMTQPRVQFIDALTATIGSVGLVAGKVVFKWMGK